MRLEKDFRFDIAFLRALAVLIVVLYHLGVPYFSQGYVGVDIFFVLSGYLMTSILVGQIGTGWSTLKEFYFRRIRRIFPALFTLILAFLLLVYLLLEVKLYDYSRYAFSSSIFVSNVYYYLNSGYFQPDSKLNFLLHTWSLSVEIQFYIVYPLLLLGLRRMGINSKQHISYCLAVLSGISILAMAYYAKSDSSFAFYMLPTRAWEFLIGGVVFLQQDKITQRLPLMARNTGALLLLVVVLLFVCGILFPISSAWPSLQTVFPVAAVALILLLQSELKIYRHSLVRLVADISYSWYLWHWPLIVLATYFAFNRMQGWQLALFVLSFVLAFLSYRFVEKSHWFRSNRSVFVLTSITVLVTLCGRQIPSDRILWGREHAALARFAYDYPRFDADTQFGFDKGHLLSNKDFDTFDTTSLVNFDTVKQTYLLLGDCHAGMFFYTLDKLANQQGVQLLQATGDDTFPAPGVKSIYPGPTALMDYIYTQYLPAHHDKIDKVILSADYSSYSKEQLMDFFQQTEAYFAALGIPTLYIGQTESYAVEFPVIYTLQKKFGIPTDKYLTHYRGNANNFLKESTIAEKYIDIYLRAQTQHADKSQTYIYDADHFSTLGTEQYRDILKRRIFE